MKAISLVIIIVLFSLNAYAVERELYKCSYEGAPPNVVFVNYYPNQMNGEATTLHEELPHHILQCINEMTERSGGKYEAINIRPFSFGRDGHVSAFFELRKK